MVEVSVIMPVYNTKEEYLRAVIENILSRTYTNSDALQKEDSVIKQKMLNFLTEDKNSQSKLKKTIFSKLKSPKIKYTLWQEIFSIKNYTENGVKRKIVSIFGIKIKFKSTSNQLIVRIKGGLGNQMFQYAFGQALQTTTGKEVIYDISWFEDSKQYIVNNKKETSDGVVIRPYNLDIFDLKMQFSTREQNMCCRKIVRETKEFEFDKELLTRQKSAIYDGYFQNERYLKCIQKEIKQKFQFPQIDKDDEFNQHWLKRIKTCENSVFIHFRRGDYVNLGWDLSTGYYKKAIEYIKSRVQNPTFFVFGQDCEDYIRMELTIPDVQFEIIGEENSKNNEDWKDIVLMKQCQHAVIANSTFSWWAAWLGRANEGGIVVAPTPFVNGKDSIICDNWIKIQR